MLRHPCFELIEHGATLLTAARTPRLGRVARERRVTLDREEPRHNAETFERHRVPEARGVHAASAAMTPASRAAAASTFDEVGDVGSVALHVAREGVAEEGAHAVRGRARRVDEAHPAGVGPTPDRARPDPHRRGTVEDRDARGVGPEQPGPARLQLDELGDRHEQVDRGRHAPAKSLRRDVDPARAQRVAWAPCSSAL